MKKFDESRLTAYALGELADDEKGIVEERLERSPELRRELQEIQAAIAQLKGELIEEAARETALRRAPAPTRRRWVIPAASAAAAAGLLLAVWIPNWQGMWEAFETPDQESAQVIIAAKGDRVGTRVEPVPGSEEPSKSMAAAKPPSEETEQPSTREGGSGPVERDDSSKPAEQRDPAVGPDQKAGIAGRILDPTGAPVPGADVTVSGTQGELEKSTITDSSGRFELAGVPPGKYEVKARLPGFKESRKTVELASGRTEDWNARLELGEIAETVTVAAEPSPMMSMTAAAVSRREAAGYHHPAAAIEHPSSMIAGRLSRGFLLPAEADEMRPIQPPFHTEAYDRIVDNPFIRTGEDPLSTFSIDVDTASYSNVRRFLNDRQLPPPDAVRIEEMVNYFTYDYPAPSGKHPFSVQVETASAPWKPSHRLLKIGLKGVEIAKEERPPGNFVFLIDVSGSMRPANKLPLLQRALKIMVRESLQPQDRVAIVVYAGDSGVALDSTSCENSEVILAAIERLQSGGRTHGAAGIREAYEIARRNFIPGGINRVILATDGDFNVGVTSQGELTRLIEEKAKTGVFLTVLGFGMGNFKDSMLEQLANRGNGNYAYIDTLAEARKVLIEQAGGTLVTIAKDVKIQLEFNPAQVAAFRLIGYENRVLAHQDFNDDKKDAGDIGSGHNVTALYELIPAGREVPGPTADPLRYQEKSLAQAAKSDELLFVKLRYKEPEGEKSRLIELAVRDSGQEFAEATSDFRFAASVAAFGMVLRDSPHRGKADLDMARKLAQDALGADPGGYRADFLQMIKRAQALKLLEEGE